SHHGPGETRLWNAGTGAELWSGQAKGQGAMLLGFAEGGKSIVQRRDSDNAIVILDRETGKELRTFPTMPSRGMRDCSLSPDGAYVAMGSDRNGLRVWNVATGNEEKSLATRIGSVHWVAFSRDGKTIVTGGDGSTIMVREVPSGKFVRQVDLGRAGIRYLAFCGETPLVAVQFYGEQTLHVFNLTTGKAIPIASDGHD